MIQNIPKNNNNKKNKPLGDFVLLEFRDNCLVKAHLRSLFKASSAETSKVSGLHYMFFHSLHLMVPPGALNCARLFLLLSVDDRDIYILPEKYEKPYVYSHSPHTHMLTGLTMLATGVCKSNMLIKYVYMNKN